MPTQAMPKTQIEISETHSFSLAERYMLKRFHPRRIMADMASLPWVVYFLWANDWRAALAVAVIAGGLAFYSVWNTDAEAMAGTPLGKLALLHLHPLNMSLQIAGLIPLIYGIWTHSTEYILSGLSLLFLGHVFGWSRVDARLAQKHD